MTPEQFIANSPWILGAYMVFAVGITIYSLWLNYQQAKVYREIELTNYMLGTLIDEVRGFRKMVVSHSEELDDLTPIGIQEKGNGESCDHGKE